MAVDVFISYPRADHTRVEVIKIALEGLGLTVFFDVEQLDAGEEFPDRIDREVKTARVVLGCWNPHALTRAWIRRECRVGQRRNVLLPVAIGDLKEDDIPVEFDGLHVVSLVGFDGSPDHTGWVEVVRSLSKRLGKQLRAPSATALKSNSEPLRNQATSSNAELLRRHKPTGNAELLSGHGSMKKAEAKRPVAPFDSVKTTFQTLVLNLDTGAVKIRFRPDLAPNHVQRIGELANEGFYNDVPFHRVIAGFMAQGGDGGRKNGTGGSTKPNLKQEFNAEPHARGVCSMARTNDPNSANSQFFICLDDARFLDKQYTVWGVVSEGMDAVDALPKGEPPRNPGKIISAKAE